MQPTLASNGPASPIAVLLNANARSVDARVTAQIQGVVPAEHLFLSRCAEEANRIADTVVDRGYGTVFTGGGDGTFVSWVNQILDRAERQDARPPRFGVLPLGTGNAVAEVVGAKRRGIVEDLRRYLRGEVPCFRQLELITLEGRRTPFVGLGVDAAILNDYRWLRQRLAGTRFSRLAAGVRGYGLAIAVRTAPRQIAQRRPPYCEILNVGAAAWRLDAQGRRVGRPVEPGEMLYAGPCILAAAGTVPYYGFGLKVFPYALERPGTMQLRVAADIGVASLLWNVPRIWKGSFSHPGLLDFQVERVEIGFDRPVPFQVGGDAEGERERLTLGMAPRSVEVVDFAGALARA
ncbi:MAG TPA: diacylglycerol kinase family protein [Anaeromyxobacteraceae bacterium]|nr:diacylglycerol kinase family protein [Anaeromyxobacteraceae bacterium]